MRGSIVIGGAVAQKPAAAGHAWVFLQYLLGFRRLGWDVLLLDAFDSQKQAEDDEGAPVSLDRSRQHSYLRGVLSPFGLEGGYCLLDGFGGASAGMPRRVLLERVRQADLFLNVMGYIEDPEVLAAARYKAFLDIDPGFPQIWRAKGLADLLTGYQAWITIGENISRSDCPIPDCGLNWVATRQPIVMEHWPVSQDVRRGFTSVASWRGAYGPLEFGGRQLGLRVHEFRKFVSLPLESGAEFELALDIHPEEERDLQLLRRNNWNLVDPRIEAGTLENYRRFVQQSYAEFMVAKGIYVELASGWFSDRTTCYLASGKPALVQDTGLKELYPLGCGLLAFSSLEEAVEGVRSIRADYSRHARAARSVAQDCFESDYVLGRLLDRLGFA